MWEPGKQALNRIPPVTIKLQRWVNVESRDAIYYYYVLRVIFGPCAKLRREYFHHVISATKVVPPIHKMYAWCLCHRITFWISFRPWKKRAFLGIVDLFVVPLPFYLVVFTWFKGSMYILHGRGRTPGMEASWTLLRSFSLYELLVLGHMLSFSPFTFSLNQVPLDSSVLTLWSLIKSWL